MSESHGHGFFRESDSYAKVVFLGESGVGKTCLFDRLQGEPFNPEKTSTIGTAFKLLKFIEDEQEYSLRLWDRNDLGSVIYL